MKVNDTWISIVTCLKAASEAAAWAFWRERFNTNHPENIRQAEIENPTQFAYANWVAAKHVYCIHKEEMDNHLRYLTTESEAYPGLSQEVELFIAMKRTVEKEMSEQLESQVLKEDKDMGRKKYEEPEVNLNEELDEDEQYVKESSGESDLWGGDEYLGEELELEDSTFFDDEDDDIDWGLDDEE